MLRNILKLEGEIKEYDASDALAVAVCHHFQDNSPVRAGGKAPGKKSDGWGDFIRKNPGKVRGGKS
jgi:crossover junction endodeoxyribonuclease RuvC